MTRIVLESPIAETFRVAQVRGLFDVPSAAAVRREWDVPLDLDGWDWRIGLVVGPSGSGKSVIGRSCFPGARFHAGYDWPAERAVVDGFPESLDGGDVCEALSKVGFSSPPEWLKRFAHLSTGQKFRAELARLMLTETGTVVVDEFTSVIDRVTARVGCAAVGKALRARRDGPRLVALACHYDIIDWLNPDWVLDTAGMRFERRALRRRPDIGLAVYRCAAAAWRLFKGHHYLTADIHPNAQCFVGVVEERPAAFTAVVAFPHPVSPGWREHRTVCLPDFQGVGIGNAMSGLIASAFTADGSRYASTTSHPAMIAHRMRSPLWRMIRRPGRVSSTGIRSTTDQLRKRCSAGRITASFRYVGPAMDAIDAAAFTGRGPGSSRASAVALEWK